VAWLFGVKSGAINIGILAVLQFFLPLSLTAGQFQFIMILNVPYTEGLHLPECFFIWD